MKTDPARAEQDEEILRLRCAGLSLRAIASRVGLSHQGVSDRITAALAELVTPAAEEYRQLEAARLEDLSQRAYDVLDEADTGDLALKAIDRLTKLSESRRKLWALDMPQPIDIALSRRNDLEADVVVDALSAVVDVLGLDEGHRVMALQAAQWALGGREGPGPEVSASVVDEGQAARAEMEQKLRDLTADEPEVDVDALLAELDDDGEDDSDGR